VNPALRRGLVTAAVSGGFVLLGTGIAYADQTEPADHPDPGTATKSHDTKAAQKAAKPAPQQHIVESGKDIAAFCAAFVSWDFVAVPGSG